MEGTWVVHRSMPGGRSRSSTEPLGHALRHDMHLGQAGRGRLRAHKSGWWAPRRAGQQAKEKDMAPLVAAHSLRCLRAPLPSHITQVALSVSCAEWYCIGQPSVCRLLPWRLEPLMQP
jgi:hypothetical protein